MATIPKNSWVSSTALAVSTTHTWFIYEINFIGEFYDIVLIMRYLANTVTGLAFTVDDFKMSAFFLEISWSRNERNMIIEVHHVRCDNKLQHWWLRCEHQWMLLIIIFSLLSYSNNLQWELWGKLFCSLTATADTEAVDLAIFIFYH